MFGEPECDAQVVFFKDDLFGCNHDEVPVVLGLIERHKVHLLRVDGFQNGLIVLKFVFQDSSDELEGDVAFAFGLPTEWPEQIIINNHLKILGEFFLPFGSTCPFRLSWCFGFGVSVNVTARRSGDRPLQIVRVVEARGLETLFNVRANVSRGQERCSCQKQTGTGNGCRTKNSAPYESVCRRCFRQ